VSSFLGCPLVQLVDLVIDFKNMLLAAGAVINYNYNCAWVRITPLSPRWVLIILVCDGCYKRFALRNPTKMIKIIFIRSILPDGNA